MFVKQVSSLAKFSPGKMGKSDVFQGNSLFAGLNCFEPGQEHAPHAHEGQDKLYLILEGSGTVQVGAGASTVIAGTQHSTLQSGSDKVVAGSSVPVHAAPVPGGHGSGFPVDPGHIAQAGPTAAGIKAGHPPTAAPGVTLPDKTKVNVSGVTPVNIGKHSGHG